METVSQNQQSPLLTTISTQQSHINNQIENDLPHPPNQESQIASGQDISSNNDQSGINEPIPQSISQDKEERDFDEMISLYTQISQDKNLMKSKPYRDTLAQFQNQLLLVRAKKMSYIGRLVNIMGDLNSISQNDQEIQKLQSNNQIDMKSTEAHQLVEKYRMRQENSQIQEQITHYQKQINQIDKSIGFNRSRVVSQNGNDLKFLQEIIGFNQDNITQSISFIADETDLNPNFQKSQEFQEYSQQVTKNQLNQIFLKPNARILILIQTNIAIQDQEKSNQKQMYYTFGVYQNLVENQLEIFSITNNSRHQLKPEMTTFDNGIISPLLQVDDKLLMTVGLFKDIQIFNEFHKQTNTATLGLSFESTNEANIDMQYLGGNDNFAITNLEIYQIL